VSKTSNYTVKKKFQVYNYRNVSQVNYQLIRQSVNVSATRQLGAYFKQVQNFRRQCPGINPLLFKELCLSVCPFEMLLTAHRPRYHQYVLTLVTAAETSIIPLSLAASLIIAGHQLFVTLLVSESMPRELVL